MTFNVWAIIILVLGALLGAWRGFGKTLAFVTGGIVGVIIAILLCSALGETIRRIGGIWAWTNKSFVYVLVYYVILFFAMQLLRIVIVKIIGAVMGDGSDNKVIIGINKTLGALLMIAFVILLALVFFALTKRFESLDFFGNCAKTIKGSWFKKIYFNNFIKF